MSSSSSFRLPLAGLVFVVAVALNACKKDDPAPPDTTDRDVFAFVAASDTAAWFGLDSALRVKTTGSGHSTPWLRVRYNATAALQLDAATGRVRPGAVFAEGALIVKELHRTPTSGVAQYAVIRKDPRNANAAANGWVWAIYNADGTPEVSATAKGLGCTGCHAQSGNLDATLMNQFFP